MNSTTGSLFQALALVVVLACWLLVAMTLVPMLASKFLSTKPLDDTTTIKCSRFQQFFDRLERRYASSLSTAVRRRGRVFGVTGLLVLGTLLLWPMIEVELTPPTDADEISVNMEMAQGTNFTVVKEYLEELERAVLLALVLMYMLMAGQFERFLDPLIVMFAVPVALARVVIGGLMASTLITLVLIPVVYYTAYSILDRIRAWRASLQSASVTPAPSPTQS